MLVGSKESMFDVGLVNDDELFDVLEDVIFDVFNECWMLMVFKVVVIGKDDFFLNFIVDFKVDGFFIWLWYNFFCN